MKGNRKSLRGKEKVIENETIEDTTGPTSLDSMLTASQPHPPKRTTQPSQQDGPCSPSQLSASASHKQLSATTSLPPNSDHDERDLIEVDEEGNFQPDNKPVSAIVKAFTTMFGKACGTWCSTPPDVRETWFNELRKDFRWAEGDERRIRKAFHTHGSKRFTDTLSQVKKRKVKPGWMTNDDYDRMKEHWNSEKHKSYAAANAKNRLGRDGSGPTLHTAGARPFYMVAKNMEKKLQRKPTLRELVNRTHTHADTHKKAGKAVDKKSEFIMREFSEKVTAARTVAAAEEHVFPTDGTLNLPAPPSVDEMPIYLEVAGGVKKGGSIYGLGSLSSKPGSSGSFDFSQKRKHDEEMTERMKQMKKENDDLREDVKMMKKQMDNIWKMFKMQQGDGQVDVDDDDDGDGSD